MGDTRGVVYQVPQKEQDSQSSAVLRREAEQLLAQTGGTYSNQGQSVTFDVRPLLREVEVFLEAFARRQRADLWPLIQAVERACWKRKWSEVTAARKALEEQIGKRPHDPLFTLARANAEGTGGGE